MSNLIYFDLIISKKFYVLKKNLSKNLKCDRAGDRDLIPRPTSSLRVRR